MPAVAFEFSGTPVIAPEKHLIPRSVSLAVPKLKWALPSQPGDIAALVLNIGFQDTCVSIAVRFVSIPLAAVYPNRN